MYNVKKSKKKIDIVENIKNKADPSPSPFLIKLALGPRGLRLSL